MIEDADEIEEEILTKEILSFSTFLGEKKKCFPWNMVKIS